MISFETDYVNGAHPEVLRALIDNNDATVSGYGSDPFCESAAGRIRTACECPGADVIFLTGGTQTNSVVITSYLREYEGVIAVTSGHISTHEAGAVEGTGHKVLALPAKDGKLTAETLRSCLVTFYEDSAHDHMVQPGMVYISHPTELGTLYSKAELTAISDICREYDMPLFLDGARLAYGLQSRGTDVTLPDIARLCDAFYIGGTKCGALCGEAVVFSGRKPEHFFTVAKRHGAIMAKGRTLGVQFGALFTDDLYARIGRYAIDMAMQLKSIFTRHGCRFAADSPTNQQFIILSDAQAARLREEFSFENWERFDADHMVVRFVTSWSTKQSDLDALDRALGSL